MAHGSPRKEYCEKCNLYGLTPRFNESKCPECGGKVRSIGTDELKKKLGLLIINHLPISFTWYPAEPEQKEEDNITDSEHLKWVHDRIINVYGESPNVDFLIKMREIIQNIKDKS